MRSAERGRSQATEVGGRRARTKRRASRWTSWLFGAALGATLAGASGFTAPTTVEAQELTESRRVRIARRLSQSAVSVRAGDAGGSGFVVGSERWIVTNAHVVEQARGGLRVRFGSGTELGARVIQLDRSHDLAVLEVVGTVPSPPLDLADSDDVEVGQTVLAYGSPFGLDGTLTEGIISARRDVPGIGGGMARQLIQTDAPINPGNSGGPLVDRRGRVIGVNTAILSRTGGSHGIGFAVPANYVSELITRTRTERTTAATASHSTREVPTPSVVPNTATGTTPTPPPAQAGAFLGVEIESFNGGGFSGARVRRVFPGSPAYRSGLLGYLDQAPELVLRQGIPWTGHIITHLDGAPVTSAQEFDQLIAAHHAGDRITVTVTVGPGFIGGSTRIVLAAPPSN